ncbi:MAG: hypothetical protein GQ570_10975 [Helicobacteraceae bacterium]|nr:hypothetical protein [Helicobacteraceae bacterium]
MSVKLASCEHELFKAHFPTQPLLAGFLLIDIVASVLKDEVSKIKVAKFIAPIFPEDVIVYNIKTEENTRSIIVKKESKKVSEVRYEFIKNK